MRNSISTVRGHCGALGSRRGPPAAHGSCPGMRPVGIQGWGWGPTTFFKLTWPPSEGSGPRRTKTLRVVLDSLDLLAAEFSMIGHELDRCPYSVWARNEYRTLGSDGTPREHRTGSLT